MDSKFKINDRVKVIYPQGIRIGCIKEVKYDGVYDVNFGGGATGHDIAEGLITKILSQEDVLKDFNPDEHRIETPFQDLLANEKWESYRRAVAGQIAVKLANVENRSPAEVGRYAVETATMVVKQLREITI